MDIAAIINDQRDLCIKEQLDRHVNGISERETLEWIQELLLTATKTDELVAEIVSEAWKYLEAHRLWQSNYPTLEAFKDAINYRSTVRNVLERHEKLTQQQQAAARQIHANWNRLPHEVLPPDIRPPKFGRDLLIDLNRLSKICPRDQVIDMLKAQGARRSSTPAIGTTVKRNRKSHTSCQEMY